MSELSTQPVVRCKYCGKHMIVTQLKTTAADPEGKLLAVMLKAMEHNVMCQDCTARYNWYAYQGRSQDFLKGLP